MNVLIIGGTGLISTAITQQLLERGDSVTHYNRGLRPVPNGVKTIVGNHRDFAAFENQMKEAGPFDCVIDMICFQPDEVEIAVRAFEGRIGHYILCSTTDVYTKPAHRYPITEDHERKPSPSFPYAYDKAICENIINEAHEKKMFPATIIRPAATYGGAGGPVHAFRGGTYHYDRVKKGKPIIIHGDGTSLWAFCHRDDVGRAFVKAAGNERVFGKSYHVTGEEWMTWNTYWTVMAEAIGVPVPEFVHIPSDFLGKVLPNKAKWCVENFQYINIFDNSAAKRDLGFQYTISFATGIRQMIEEVQAKSGFEDSDKYPFYDLVIDSWRELEQAAQRQLIHLDEE